MFDSCEASHIDIVGIGSSLNAVGTENDVADEDLAEISQSTGDDVDFDFAVSSNLRGGVDKELELGNTVDLNSVEEDSRCGGCGVGEGRS